MLGTTMYSNRKVDRLEDQIALVTKFFEKLEIDIAKIKNDIVIIRLQVVELETKARQLHSIVQAVQSGTKSLQTAFGSQDLYII